MNIITLFSRCLGIKLAEIRREGAVEVIKAAAGKRTSLEWASRQASVKDEDLRIRVTC